MKLVRSLVTVGGLRAREVGELPDEIAAKLKARGLVVFVDKLSDRVQVRAEPILPMVQFDPAAFVTIQGVEQS